jgi:hypothetical protein
MVLKLVPISIEGVLVRLMQERYGSRPSASIEEWRKILTNLVAGERAAILEPIKSELALETGGEVIGGPTFQG